MAADTPLARKVRNMREAPPPPQIIYVPVPAAEQAPTVVSDSAQNAARSSTEPRAEEPLYELDAEARTTLANEQPQPPPVAATSLAVEESEMERRRREGARDFAQEMRYLEQKADQADIAWQRFMQGCRMNVTSISATAGVADRDWIAVAAVSVTKTEWTNACAEAGTFYALFDQVAKGMCRAETRARKSAVYPGTRRDLRRRYRLDWHGWERFCR